MSRLTEAWNCARRLFRKEPRPRAADELVDTLMRSGIREDLRRRGLVLWDVMRAPATSGGEHIYLAISLPSLNRPIEPDEEILRRKALSDRLSRHCEELVPLFARVLNVSTGIIVLNERLIETCCRRNCQSCLLNRPESKTSDWT